MPFIRLKCSPSNTGVADSLRPAPRTPIASRLEVGTIFAAADRDRATPGPPGPSKLAVEGAHLEDLISDVRLAFRTLRKSPGFSLVVVSTLALGIGANSAIFSLMDQVLLRALPVKDPQQLVILDGPGAFSGHTHNDQTFSYPMYADFRDKNAVFDGVAARFDTGVAFGHGGQTERVIAELVSGSYFPTLGIAPLLGRMIAPSDDQTPGAHPVVVLSSGFWQRRFGGDPKAVGLSVTVNAAPMTIIGVAPPSFYGLQASSAPDVFVPVMMKAQMTPVRDDLENRRSRWLNVIARLKPGVTEKQAEAGMNVLYKQILAEEIKVYPDPSERFRSRFLSKHLDVLPGARGLSELRKSFGAPLYLLMGMVGLVLLIACANVANLILARGASRQREVAIRVALGASRFRVVRQLLVESLVLALGGGLLGIVLATWTGSGLIALLPSEQARKVLSGDPDLRLLGFTLGVSVLTGLVFGLLPALRTASPSVLTTLKQEALAVVGGTHLRFRKALVVAQVALSLLLLVGAGLFARSLVNLKNLDPGFDPEGVVSFSIDPSLNGYKPAQAQAIHERLLDEMRGLPGVKGASIAVEALLTDSEASITVRVEGYAPKEGENMNPQVNPVAPDFLKTLRMPLVAGREFTREDRLGAPKVAIVNEEFARYFFGSESPIGRRFGFGRSQGTDIEIVGLARESKSMNLRQGKTRSIFVPLAQREDAASVTYYVRSAGALAGLGEKLREIVRRVDPNLPVFGMKMMTAQVGESLFLERMIALLSACFGALATALAALGLYGIMSYSVAARTREIGIRMALGADRGSVLKLVMRDVLLLAGVGIGLGLPSAIGLGRLVASQLFGLTPNDPMTLAAATTLLASVALFAGLVPARRATRIEPVNALHYQ